MKATYYQLDPRPAEPLQVTAMRYQPYNPPSDGITLILAHALGTHKETWMPLLEYLFAEQDRLSNVRNVKILEAWSIECPNHGESAVLNNHDIESKFSNFKWSGWIYPRALRAFLLSRPEGIDFHRRKLVGVGHSNGGNAMTLLHSLSTGLEFQALILLDPTLGRESVEKDHMQRVLTQLTWNKRDTWPSRKAALKDLSTQLGFRNWHPDVLRLFIEKGLKDHSASKFPDPWIFKGGVTLCCSRAYEAASNLANDHHAFAFDHLQYMYRSGQAVYLIHSKKDEFNGELLKRAQAAPDASSKRGPQSVQYIEHGGHMFVQACPQDTAKAIWNAICDAQKLQASHRSNSGMSAVARL